MKGHRAVFADRVDSLSWVAGNDARCVAMGERRHPGLGLEIARAFLTTPFSGDSVRRRIAELEQYEQTKTSTDAPQVGKRAGQYTCELPLPAAAPGRGVVASAPALGQDRRFESCRPDANVPLTRHYASMYSDRSSCRPWGGICVVARGDVSNSGTNAGA